jgi:hypothetical protein
MNLQEHQGWQSGEEENKKKKSQVKRRGLRNAI